MTPNTHGRSTLPPSGICPRVAALCLIAVIGIIAVHWAWSTTL